MTPEEALDLLDRMSAATPAARQDHVLALQAVQTLRDALAVKGSTKADE